MEYEKVLARFLELLITCSMISEICDFFGPSIGLFTCYHFTLFIKFLNYSYTVNMLDGATALKPCFQLFCLHLEGGTSQQPFKSCLASLG